MVFSTKNTKHFLGRGHGALPRPFPQWGGGYPLPTPHLSRRLDPSHLKSWVRHWVRLPSFVRSDLLASPPAIGVGAQSTLRGHDIFAEKCV